MATFSREHTDYPYITVRDLGFGAFHYEDRAIVQYCDECRVFYNIGHVLHLYATVHVDYKKNLVLRLVNYRSCEEHRYTMTYLWKFDRCLGPCTLSTCYKERMTIKGFLASVMIDVQDYITAISLNNGREPDDFHPGMRI